MSVVLFNTSITKSIKTLNNECKEEEWDLCTVKSVFARSESATCNYK